VANKEMEEMNKRKKVAWRKHRIKKKKRKEKRKIMLKAKVQSQS
jgi:hypothetical protein